MFVCAQAVAVEGPSVGTDAPVIVEVRLIRRRGRRGCWRGQRERHGDPGAAWSGACPPKIPLPGGRRKNDKKALRWKLRCGAGNLPSRKKRSLALGADAQASRSRENLWARLAGGVP